MEYSEKEYLIEGTAIDLFVAYRFLRILTTPWEDQEAFKLGIIDKDGKLSVMGKDYIKENIGRSPDFADALMMRMLYELSPRKVTILIAVYQICAAMDCGWELIMEPGLQGFMIS